MICLDSLQSDSAFSIPSRKLTTRLQPTSKSQGHTSGCPRRWKLPGQSPTKGAAPSPAPTEAEEICKLSDIPSILATPHCVSSWFHLHILGFCGYWSHWVNGSSCISSTKASFMGLWRKGNCSAYQGQKAGHQWVGMWQGSPTCPFSRVWQGVH